MKQYIKLCKKILRKGIEKHDRTGTGTLSMFGQQIKIDMSKGFPLLTTKKLHTKSIVHELLWFLSGDTNVKYLNDNGVRIWNEWADGNGDLGKIYGYQWVKSNRINQIQNLINDILNEPNSRRLIVNSWNVSELPDMNLPPCHLLFQCYVTQNKLSLHLYMRSCDVFLGLPFNIASYGLLLELLCYFTSKVPDKLIISFGDVHIYSNHITQIKEQISRKPLPLPTLHILNSPKSIFDVKFDDIQIVNYQSHPKIEGKISI
jgi:thymidylate synthase